MKQTNNNKTNAHPSFRGLGGKPDIVRTIGTYLPLKKSGRFYVGLCPFHDDHHPSLTVDPQKQTYICYACGAKGDVIHFIQEKEGCSFKEALQKLNLTPEAATGAERTKQTASKKTVPAPPPGGWGVPYSIPGLTEAYLDFEVEQAYNLLPEPWKMMQGRIIFPVRDEEGILAGYAGRGESPRYLNSPGLPRNRILYGLHRAKQEILRTGTLCLVEGFKDVIAMHAAGFTNTAGLCGTQMAEGQKELILRYAEQVVVIMDGDNAGRKAAETIIETLGKAGIDVIPVALPEGSDPDSIFREQGKEALARLIRCHMNAPHPTEYLLLTMLTLYPATTFRFQEEEYLFPQLAHYLLEKADLTFESESHRNILRYYATGIADETEKGTLEKEALLLQITYGSAIRELVESFMSYYGLPENKAREELLKNSLLCYFEARLIRLIKTLTRSLPSASNATTRRPILLDLARRRHQLTSVSESLERGGAMH